MQVALAGLKTRADRLDRLPEAAAERDIRYLEARLRTAILVEPAAEPDEVRFGCWVRVSENAGLATEYEIVGEDEADAARGRIAPVSPLARALMGARVGDVVIWRRPAGVMELEVLEIGHVDPQA